MLERSRQKQGHISQQAPLHRMVRKVSHACLALLNKELQNSIKWGDEAMERCTHVVRATHEIPCACVLMQAISHNDSVSSKWMNSFWSTLEINQEVPGELYDEAEEDKEYWESLVAEVKNADPATRARVMRAVYEELHPEAKGLTEPTVKKEKRGKGRPKGSKNKPKKVLIPPAAPSPP